MINIVEIGTEKLSLGDAYIRGYTMMDIDRVSRANAGHEHKINLHSRYNWDMVTVERRQYADRMILLLAMPGASNRFIVFDTKNKITASWRFDSYPMAMEKFNELIEGEFNGA